VILYIYSVCTLLNIIIYTQYTLYKHHCNPSTIASIYTIIPLPIKLITQHRVRGAEGAEAEGTEGVVRAAGAKAKREESY
jgi:hypothetical protein